MTRPDQAKFDSFARPFEDLDEVLLHFSQAHQFQLVKNPKRQPERDLNKSGNPNYGIGIFQHETWHQMDYVERATYDVVIVGICDETPKGRRIKRVLLVDRQPFSYILANLSEILKNSLDILNEIEGTASVCFADEDTGGWLSHDNDPE